MSYVAVSVSFLFLEINSDTLRSLEQRQFRNDSIQSRIIPIWKLPPFYPRRIGGEKARQSQNWNYFGLNGVVLILS